jgi:hypothetical protein
LHTPTLELYVRSWLEHLNLLIHTKNNNPGKVEGHSGGKNHIPNGDIASRANIAVLYTMDIAKFQNHKENTLFIPFHVLLAISIIYNTSINVL